MKIAYSNGPLFTGDEILKDTALLVEDETIVGCVAAQDIPSSYQLHDLQGALLAPAFIDLQIYGGNGRLFSEFPDVETIEQTYEYCKAGGAHHFMITLATNHSDIFRKGINAVRQYWQQGGKGLLGLHLEGPYLNPLKKGAHLEAFIERPTMERVQALWDDVIKMITVAPECCEEEVIRFFSERGVLISAGHTNATYEEAIRSFDQGIPLATHLYNAMSGLQHRAPGMVGAIFDHSTVCSSVVCDGIHVDYAAVRIAKKIMGPRLFYITDAVTHSQAGGYAHVYNEDHYTLPEGTLSGSALTMMQSVKNGIEKVGIPLEESLRMATTYPAQFLKDRKLGRLEAGWEAALIICDQGLTSMCNNEHHPVFTR